MCPAGCIISRPVNWVAGISKNVKLKPRLQGDHSKSIFLIIIKFDSKVMGFIHKRMANDYIWRIGVVLRHWTLSLFIQLFQLVINRDPFIYPGKRLTYRIKRHARFFRRVHARSSRNMRRQWIKHYHYQTQSDFCTTAALRG